MNKKLIFDGAEINYSITGSGSSVVFLHGFLEDSTMWNDFSEELSSSFQITSVDLPGFGQSGILDNSHTMKNMSKAVHTVIDKENIFDFTLVGHSMGGYVALAFAEQFESTLNGIVLFHSHAGADNEEAKTNRNRTIKIVEGNHADFISSFVPTLFATENIPKFSKEIENITASSLQTNNEGITAALVGMRDREDSLLLLAKLDIPVLFIAGKNDPKIPMETILQQVSLPKVSEVLILENVGHMGFIEAKEETYNAIESFVNRYSSN